MPTPLDQLRAEARTRVNSTLGERYKLTRLLGVGGMAAVYEATDERDGTRRAIKVLHPHIGGEQQLLRRFKREAQLLAQLAHPGIVEIYHTGADGKGCGYLVMDLLEGFSLEFGRRKLGGYLAEGHVKWVGSELLRVLTAAHEKGVIHRDIKPSNLFVTREGKLMVLDFGVARTESEQATPVLSLETAEGSVLGTPSFMSPEQARGRWREVDERSDIWSVGATLFTLASGHPVHEAETFNEALGLAMTKPARSVLEVKPDLHEGLAAVIDRALCSRPADRFQSALEMLSAFTGKQVNPAYTQSLRPDLVELVNGAKLSGVMPVQAAEALTTAARSPRSLATDRKQRSEMPTEIRDDLVLLKTKYWYLHEVPTTKVVFLRRTPLPIESTESLRLENRDVLARLGPQHSHYGLVVDMRDAPSRNDNDYEQAMRYLRHELAARFERISVLVASAVGMLQVSRIDRSDGTHTHITQDELDAIRHARQG